MHLGLYPPAADLEPWSVSGGYLNYMQADDPLEHVRAAFGESGFDRLRPLKGFYDPDNILRRNQNIPPPATLEHAAAARLGRQA